MGRSVAARAFIAFFGVIILTYGEARGEALSWEGALEKKVPESQKLVKLGEQIFNKACVHCHGETGKGDGKARRYLFLMPRDFTSGKFKIRTTSTGSPPTNEDLFRTITRGFPEYRMPRFEYLSPRERWALVYYVKTFIPSTEQTKPKPVSVGKGPLVTGELLSKGKQLFEDAECWKCHGREGKGNGPSAGDLKDDWNNPIILLDWTQGKRVFKRGARARDIMYTFMTGLAGTPMPSYADVLTPEQAWALAYYVEELIKKGQRE